MFLLQTIGVPSATIAFEEERIRPAQQAQRFDALHLEGYRLVGKHIARNVYLFKSGDRYVLAHICEYDHTPLSLGAIVENTEAIFDNLHEKDVDIFDGGAVGEMALHVPALRDAQGRFIYLVEKNRKDDFYASDFNVVAG